MNVVILKVVVKVSFAEVIRKDAVCGWPSSRSDDDTGQTSNFRQPEPFRRLELCPFPRCIELAGRITNRGDLSRAIATRSSRILAAKPPLHSKFEVMARVFRGENWIPMVFLTAAC